MPRPSRFRPSMSSSRPVETSTSSQGRLLLAPSLSTVTERPEPLLLISSTLVPTMNWMPFFSSSFWRRSVISLSMLGMILGINSTMVTSAPKAL